MVVFSISAIMTSYSKPIIQHTSTDEFVCLTKLRLFYNKIFIDTRTNFNLKHMYSVGARFFAALCQTDNYLLIICRPYIIYIFLFIIYKQCRPKKSKKNLPPCAVTQVAHAFRSFASTAYVYHLSLEPLQ